MAGTIILVSNRAELLDALATADGGEVIELAAGNYGALNLSNKDGAYSFDTTVTLRTQDSGDAAVLTGLSLNNVHNLTLDGIDLDYSFKPGDQIYTKPFKIAGGSNIAIRNAEITGDVAEGLDQYSNGAPSGVGLHTRDVKGFELTGSTISGFWKGAQITNSDDVNVSGNELYDIRSDALNFSAVQGVLIEDNYLHDLAGVEGSPDHRDMLQFWTNGTSRPSTDIVIRGNVIDVGEGSFAHSIFMRNDLVDTGARGEEMFYQNLLIEENVIIGQHAHGITVGETDGLTIRNNTVLREVSDQPGNLGLPVISVSGAARNVAIHHNVAGGVKGDKGQDDWSVTDNLIVQDHDRFGEDHYTAHFLNPAPGERSDLSNLIVRPDSVIAAEGLGAAQLLYDAQPDVFTPLVATTPVDGNRASFVFDARLSAGPDGAIGPDAVVRWSFGDGTGATGQTVSHIYAAPGRYEVTMEVADASGQFHSKTVSLAVDSPGVFRFDPETGILKGYDTGAPAAADTLVVETEDGHILRLEGGMSGVTIDRSRLDGFFGATNFRLGLDLSSDQGAAAAGVLVWLQKSLTLTLQSDTSLSAKMFNAAGDVFWITTDPLGEAALAEGLNTALVFDALAGTFALEVNGQIAAQTSAWGTTPDVTYWTMHLGAAYQRTSADVDISRLDLSAGEHYYDFADSTDPPAPINPLTDIFDLSDARDDGDLMDDAYFDETDGTLVLDGDGDWLDIGHIEALEDKNALSVSLSFTRTDADGGSERLLWKHQKLSIELLGDGLILRVASGDGKIIPIRVPDIGLNNTAEHSLTVNADADRDYIELIVDGETVLTRDDIDFQLAGAGSHEWGWWLGNAFGRYFDGEVHDLTIAAMTEDFAFDFVPDDGLLGA